VLPQQLEASLKKSAKLLQLTEKDRDEWKASAQRLAKELEQAKAAITQANDRAQKNTDKILEFAHGLREIVEQLES
jgi:chromosome segregation ATPase